MPTSKQRSGNSLAKRSSPVPDGIAAVMATILSSFFASLMRASCVDLGIGGCGCFRLRLRARRHVELDDAVIFVGRFFGRLVALALLRDDVNEERSVLGVAHVLEHRQQMIDVVAVDRPDIEESEFVEQGAAGDEAAGVFLHRHRALLEERRQQLGELLDGMAHRPVGPPRDRDARDSPTARRPAARSTCRCR